MLDLEIRKRLARYNAKRLKLADLDDWLNTESWEVRSEPVETQRLLFDAMRLIAEHDNGDWTEPELRQKLGALSRLYWFEQAPRTVVTTSEATIIRHDLGSETARRSPVEASA